MIILNHRIIRKQTVSYEIWFCALFTAYHNSLYYVYLYIAGEIWVYYKVLLCLSHRGLQAWCYLVFRKHY